MTSSSLFIGQHVRHPQYGVGVVKVITEHTADVLFDDMRRTLAPETSGLEPAEANASITALDKPLALLVREVVEETLRTAGLEKPDAVVKGLGERWHRGKMILRPADASLQAKEVELDVFFHKIVMMRNNLRTLEQRINANEKLSDVEKVDLQQYITRSYGSMTTFNTLFKDRADYFSGKE